MKNQFTSRIVKLTFAFMFVLFASSCNEDSDAMDAAVLAKEINNEISAKGTKVSASVVLSTFNLPSEVCAGEPANFCFTAPIGTNLQVQQLIDGDWVQVYQISQSTTEETCFPLTFTTAGDYQLRYKIGSGGFSAPITVSVINCGCEESFSIVANDSGSYTFTYVPAEDMEDALVEFTFAQGVAVEGLEGFTRNGNGNASVWSATSSFEACKTYTYTVTLTPDCSGSSNNSNVWTDFKVSGESKKGELANIVISCN